MSLRAWLTLLVVLAMFAVLALDRLATWLVFIATLTIMMTLRLASPEALVRGFSNIGVLTVAALFPVAAGMYSTGAISLLSERLMGRPRTATDANLRLLPAITIASAFLNNTPMVAMMIPVVRDLKRQTGLTAPTVSMGLSFASILGGNITLIGGAVNLIVSGMIADAINTGQLHGVKPVAIFDLAWIGAPAAVAGLVYLIFVASRLFSKADSNKNACSSPTRRRYLTEFRVQANSNLDGRTPEAVGFASMADARLLSIRRNGIQIVPATDQKLRSADVLVFTASSEAVAALWTTIGLVPVYGNTMKSSRHQHQLVEVVVSARSPTVGRRISDLPSPNSPYEAMLLAISRDGQAPGRSLTDLRVEVGDAVVLEVNDSFFYEERHQTDFIIIKPIEGYLVKRVNRAITASLITISMIALAATGTISMLNSALLATLAMLATGCLNSEQAWRSLDWKTLVVMGTALGLESAITGTGLAEGIAKLCSILGSHSPRVGLGVVFVITIMLTNVISNVATAAFMFPLALSMSEMLGVSFKPFAMIIMVAASCGFINPAGSQTNLMVQKDAGYTFRDFTRVGLPLTLIVGLVVVFLAPIVYGL